MICIRKKKASINETDMFLNSTEKNGVNQISEYRTCIGNENDTNKEQFTEMLHWFAFSFSAIALYRITLALAYPSFIYDDLIQGLIGTKLNYLVYYKAILCGEELLKNKY